MHCDVSPCVLEARQIIQAAANVYMKHLQEELRCILIHGSAYKGGFIAGCSDIDFQLYLDNAAFTSTGEIALDRALAIQRDLAQINPAPFLYIQAYTYSLQPLAHKKVRSHLGPVPGTYHLLFGTLPRPEAQPEQVLQRAHETLKGIRRIPGEVAEDLIGAGGERIWRKVRLLCTDIWPTLYSLLTVRQAEEPMSVWRLPKTAVITQLSENEPAGREIRRFYTTVTAYYSQGLPHELALQALERGVIFTQTVIDWYEENYGQITR